MILRGDDLDFIPAGPGWSPKTSNLDRQEPPQDARYDRPVTHYDLKTKEIRVNLMTDSIEAERINKMLTFAREKYGSHHPPE
jgi:hypothetical protein